MTTHSSELRKLKRRVGIAEEAVCIKKERLGNLNFLCPSPSLDFRLSASVENPAPMPRPKPKQPGASKPTPSFSPIGHLYNDRRDDDVRLIRRKDRTSYFFEIWSVDMTTVKSYSEMVGERYR